MEPNEEYIVAKVASAEEDTPTGQEKLVRNLQEFGKHLEYVVDKYQKKMPEAGDHINMAFLSIAAECMRRAYPDPAQRKGLMAQFEAVVNRRE